LDGGGDPMFGTHMSPPRFFGIQEEGHEENAFRIDAVADTGISTVSITRCGGLFVPIPDASLGADQAARVSFVEAASHAINLVLCEFAFAGQVSVPASPVQMSAARRVHDYVVITIATGGREMYEDRTLGPLAAVDSGRWYWWPRVDAGILRACSPLDRARELEAISSALPELIVGAYSNFSRHHPAEAIVDGWVVIEQLLDELWERHRGQSIEPGRRSALGDRTYTAAVRVEVLLAARLLPPDLYGPLTAARSKRNALAHRGEASIDGAQLVLDAMRTYIEWRLGTTVAPPEVMRGVTW
jgi:hypothetical protein